VRLKGRVEYVALYALGLAQSNDTVAIFPLAAGLQNLNALKAFHDIALGAAVAAPGL